MGARSLTIGRNGDFIVDHIIQMSDENVDGEFMAVADEYDEFEGDVTVHKVVNGQSQKVSIFEILPTRTQRKGLDVDFVVNAEDTELQSGSMSWSEASVDKAHSGCGRSSLGENEKRARILALANEVVTKDLTSTSTVTETAAATVTFSVGVTCTSAGFTSPSPCAPPDKQTNSTHDNVFNESHFTHVLPNDILPYPGKLFISITDQINLPIRGKK